MNVDPEVPAPGPGAPDVTVVIPTLDGERYLTEVLASIAGQEDVGVVETLVIDSGSTDRTLDIVRAAGVRLHQIPNGEFGHGRTRNLGARLARGRIVAFLTQDATPAGPHWLRELVAPLELDGVAGAFGRQLPRTHCVPLIKYDLELAFTIQRPIDRVTVQTAAGASDEELDRTAFYSDVNAASTRAFLTEVLPYRDISYSEDLAFARDALRAGFGIAYAPAGAVVHSNDVTVRGYRARMRDEILGHRRVGTAIRPVSMVRALAHAGLGALRDTARIARDPDYRPRERLRWLVVNPAYHLARWRGIVDGSRVPLDGDA